MTSATGNRWGARGGFTLVEILLVTALMGLLAGICLTGASMLPGGGAPRGMDVFWQAVAQARERAVSSDCVVILAAVESGRALTVSADGPARRIELPAGDQLRVVDSVVRPDGFSAPAVAPVATPSVRFYPDGTCDAFCMEIRSSAGGTLAATVDPWTCARDLRPGPAPRS